LFFSKKKERKKGKKTLLTPVSIRKMPPACRLVGVDVEVGLQVPYGNRSWRVKKRRGKRKQKPPKKQDTSADSTGMFLQHCIVPVRVL